MKDGITPTQLFLLSFSNLFAGFYKTSPVTLLTAAGQVTVFLFFSALAMAGTRSYSGSLSRFFRSFGILKWGVLTLFLLLAAFPLGETAKVFVRSTEGICPFLPRWVLVILPVAVLACLMKKGLTAFGRLAELSLFLLIPMVFVRPFGALTPLSFGGKDSPFPLLAAFSAVVPFFLAAKTVTAGDAVASPAMAVSGRVPRDRALYLFSLMAGASLGAFGLYAWFSLFTFKGADVFLTLFLWMLYALRLGVLGGIYRDIVCEIAEKRHKKCKKIEKNG